MANDSLCQKQQKGEGAKGKEHFTDMPSPGISKSRGQYSVLAGEQNSVPCLSLGLAHQPWLWDSRLLSQTMALGSFGLQTAKPPGVTFDGSRTGSLFQGFAAVSSSNLAVDNQ